MLIDELKAIQHRRGYLPREELYALSERTNVPLWQIHGVASFYPHFRLEPPPAMGIKVCQDYPCHLGGGAKLRRLVEETARDAGMQGYEIQEVSCLGRCDRAPVLAINDEIYSGVTAKKLTTLLKQVAAGKKPRRQPLVKGAGFRVQGSAIDYQSSTLNPQPSALNYTALRGVLESGDADGVIQTLKDSDLRGMGGAGFPAGVKWDLVRREPPRPPVPADPLPHIPKYVICNADESEPGTFKDRVLLQTVPHLILEGMLIAMRVVGAPQGIIYIRHEYYREREVLERELRRVERSGLRVKGLRLSLKKRPGAQPSTLNPQPLTLEIFESPGGYICGEETALLEALEGKRAEPRNKPPFPSAHGLWQKPTLINNVETFAWVPAILLRGAEWFKARGQNGAAGLKFFALSGHVRKPGVYEVPLGIPAAELIFQHGGGLVGRKKLKAFSPGGASSGFLPASMVDVPLEFRALAQAGSMLGSGAVVAIAEGTCMLDLALNVVRFFRNESCGKCVPCRAGSEKIVGILENIRRGNGKPEDLDLIGELAEAMQLTSICGLGQAAPLPITSVLQHFKEEVDAHVLRGECPAGVCFK